MKLFQYWHTDDPPAEIAEWIEGFRINNPDFEHNLFDEKHAYRFIRQYHGVREAAAFATLAVPAFQADFFRLCALLTFGGLYVDADNQSIQPLDDLIVLAPHALIFTLAGQLNNGFLMFRRREDAFLRACLTLCIENIETRRFDNCFLAAGPGVFNAVRLVADPGSRSHVEDLIGSHWMDRGFSELADHAQRIISPTKELATAYQQMTQIDVFSTFRWIGAVAPVYKQTDQHWMNWTQSVYR